MRPCRRRAIRRAFDLMRVVLGGAAFALCIFGLLWAVELVFVPPD
jgi:hypothetical protein